MNRVEFVLVLFLISIGLCSTDNVAQSKPKEITRDEYFAPRRSSFEMVRGHSYRRKVKTDIFESGKLTSSTEFLYEWMPDKRSRMVRTETTSTGGASIEQIDIDGKKYCKKGSGPWEIPKTYCIGGSGSGGPSNISSDKYTVENDPSEKGNRIYRNYTVYKNTWSATKEREGLSFWESSYWVDPRGVVVKEETRKGLVDGRQIQSIEVTISEFDPPNLRIEAPVL